MSKDLKKGLIGVGGLGFLYKFINNKPTDMYYNSKEADEGNAPGMSDMAAVVADMADAALVAAKNLALAARNLAVAHVVMDVPVQPQDGERKRPIIMDIRKNRDKAEAKEIWKKLVEMNPGEEGRWEINKTPTIKRAKIKFYIKDTLVFEGKYIQIPFVFKKVEKIMYRGIERRNPRTGRQFKVVADPVKGVWSRLDNNKKYSPKILIYPKIEGVTSKGETITYNLNKL